MDSAYFVQFSSLLPFSLPFGKQHHSAAIVYSSPLARGPLKERTHLDKICQIDWKTPLVEKCCVAGFFQLRMRNAIASLSPLAIDVYSYEHSFTKPYHVGHPPFHCSAVITTS